MVIKQSVGSRYKLLVFTFCCFIFHSGNLVLSQGDEVIESEPSEEGEPAEPAAPITANSQKRSAPEEPPPQLSAFALRMQGVCAKKTLIEDYLAACSSSATGVLPDNDIFKPPDERPISHILKIRAQNNLIMSELIHRALYNNPIPTHHPKFGFELVSTTFAIYGEICPVIPNHFLRAVFHLFSYISWKTAHNRKEYLNKNDQRWILKLLNNCTLNLRTVPLMTDVCKETVYTSTNCNDYICTEPKHEFRLLRTDPILDVVFKTMELVQSMCFPYFAESYRMFHFYHLGVMDTYTEEMKTRWLTQLEGRDYWDRLLGPGFEEHLINMERCNQVGISNAAFHYRIYRNSLPARIRLAGRVTEYKAVI